MSSIGKIFVVLNLVLAAAFVGWAANAVSTSGDWMKKYNDAVAVAGKSKLDLDEELKKVRAELGLSKADLLTAMNAKEEAKRAADRLTTEKTELSVKNSNLDAAIVKIETTLGGISDARNKAEADSKKAMASASAAETARRTAELAQQTAEEAQAAAEAQMRDTTNQVAGLEKEKTTLVNEMAKLQRSFDTVVAMTGTKIQDIQATPKIDGLVLGVETKVKPGLVAINKGEVDGVRRGQTFDIFSGSTYKGQIKIEFVHADMASGLITRPVDGQTMSQGDGATTRL